MLPATTQKAVRAIRLIILFYRNFWLFTSLITGISACLFRQHGYSIAGTLFWFKIGTLYLVYRFINKYKEAEFYYYRNLGMTKRTLWIATMLIDMTVYFFVLSLITPLR